MPPTSRFRPRPLAISQHMTVGRAALILAAMIGLSRLTGFGRLVVTSTLFGRGEVTDAYLAAFNIPDTLAILISGGLLATGFVPVFTAYLTRGQVAEAQKTFRALFTLIGLGFGAISLVLFFLTYTPAGTLLAPSSVEPAMVDLYLRVLRILLVAQFLFVMGGVFAGTLNALRLFWFAALQPVLFNCGTIIFGIGGHLMGWSIDCQAWGALAGALAGTLFILAPAAHLNGLSLRPLLDLKDQGVRQVAASLLPIIFGLASGQIIALNLPRAFAKTLEVGATSTLDYANRLMQVPLDMLASGFAVALFPTLARLWVESKPEELRQELAAGLTRILSLMLFAAFMTAALAKPLVSLLLQHGKFSAEDANVTSWVLVCYATCLPALGAQQLLARGFFAIKRSQEPIGVGIMAVALFLMLGYCATLFPMRGGAGLALAAAVANTGLAWGLWYTLRRHVGDMQDARVIRSALLALAVAALAGVLAFAVATGLSHLLAGLEAPTAPSLLKTLGRLVVLIAGAASGIAIWMVVGKRLGVSDLRRPKSKGG